MNSECLRRFGFFAVVFAVSACASDDKLDRPVFEQPATALDYEVQLDGLPTDEMKVLAEQSLAVYRRQDEGAQSTAFLRRRAESDMATLQSILRSRGHYQGEVSVDVTLLEMEDEPDDDALRQANVVITVVPGPAFTLMRHDLQVVNPSGSAPALVASDLGSPVGSAAEAAGIVGAEKAALNTLQAAGFPYAELGSRRAVADLDEATLEVDTPIVTGPSALFGPVEFIGLEDVRERYLRTYVPWEYLDTFDSGDLRSYQQALLGTDLFDAVTVRAPERPPNNDDPIELPIVVTAEERPFQTVSAGLRFSTDEGPSVEAGFEHRNLFGENETLTLEAEAGLQIQSIGIGYREPQYMRSGQDLLGSFTLEHEEDDAFDALTATAVLGLERRLNRYWLVGAGVLGEASLISDDGQDTTAYLGGIPLFASYDGSDDLLNPTEGARARLDVTPFAGLFDDAFAGFFLADAQGSAYYDITGEKDYILAGRTRWGTILAGDVSDVPQTRRLYSGGGGSVRGFAQRFIGPLDASNDPIGGLSALELGVELRARLFGDVGGVVFAEAGSVSEQSFPDFNEGVQVAAGLGVRYFSPAGPIRIDVAFPLDPRDADDRFQIYFSIGQAF